MAPEASKVNTGSTQRILQRIKTILEPWHYYWVTPGINPLISRGKTLSKNMAVPHTVTLTNRQSK